MTAVATVPLRDLQLGLFNGRGGAERFALVSAPAIDVAVAAGAPVVLGVSGGRDLQALALRVSEHLDDVGHAGPRLLIHSDLGRVEWRDSLPVCQRLAERLGLELVVVRRHAGDMLDRWRSRWAGNVRRYAAFECVKLILPWSTPAQRFCTSELKSAVIASAMRRRFAAGDVISAVGIRAEEYRARARMPVSKTDPRTAHKHGAGHVWNAILRWTRADVMDYLRHRGVALHEAYTVYGSSRVSRAFCIMSSADDLRAAAGCADNAAVYRLMVALEISSTFAFQAQRWLADVAPQLLEAGQRARLADAKEQAAARMAAEARLPGRLLYTAGWPTQVPVESARWATTIRRACGIATPS